MNDVSKFLCDHTSVLPISSRTYSRSRYEALTECIFHVKTQKNNIVLDAARYLFRILLLGDIACTIYGNKKQIRNTDLTEFMDFVQEKYEKLNTTEQDRIGLMDKNEPTEDLSMILKTLVKRGQKLEWVCKIYGTGSLFYLHSILNDNL